MSLRNKIIHESLRLFSLKGFESTSLHDILTASNASKGGFYNHFASKEDLFYEVLQEAGKIWRKRNLTGLDRVKEPIQKIKALLENFRDQYLLDSDNFPGGCIFITFAVELGDQRPHLSREVNKGFVGLKDMIYRFIDEGKRMGELRNGVDPNTATEIIFNGMLGASVNYNANKSVSGLVKSINALIDYLEHLKS